MADTPAHDTYADVRDGRVPTIALLILAAISGVTFLVFRLIPGVDFPNHLAVATVIRYFGAAGNSFADYFRIEAFLRPCVLHSMFCSLPIWPSVEFGHRLLIAAYAAGLPLSGWLILRRTGGSLWVGLLSLLLIHNFNMCWGFVGFMMAIPVVLVIVDQTLAYASAPSVRRAVGISLLCAGLYLVHVLALLFVHLFLAVTTLVVFRRNWRRLLHTVAIIAPSALLVVWWWLQQPTYGMTTSQFLWEYYSGPFLQFFSQRPFQLVTLDNYFLFAAEKGIAAGIINSAVMIVVAGAGIALGWKSTSTRGDGTQRRVLVSFLIVALVCFLLLPHKLQGESYIYQRFSCLVYLALVVVGATCLGRRTPGVIRGITMVAAVASVVLWTDYVRDFNDANRSFTPDVFAAIDTHEPVAALMFDDEFRGQPLYMQFPNYFIIWNQGVITTSVVDYRFGLIRRNVTRDVLPIYNPIVGRFPNTFDPASISTPYIVTRGQAPASLRTRLALMRVVNVSGEWTVYHQSR